MLRVGVHSNALRTCAPHTLRQRLDGKRGVARCIGVLAPKGSRLSCGRNTSGRKKMEPQTERLAGEATQFLPTCERSAASSAC